MISDHETCANINDVSITSIVLNLKKIFERSIEHMDKNVMANRK